MSIDERVEAVEVDVDVAAAAASTADAVDDADAARDHDIACSDAKGAFTPAADVVAADIAVEAIAAATPSVATTTATATDTTPPVSSSLSSSSSKIKQTRASLTIHEKSIVKSFCEQRVEESKARGEVVPSQELLRRDVLSKFGWEMGRSTLSKVMLMDWKDLGAGAHRNPTMKRKRKPLFPAFEADLVKYIGAHIAQHEALTASQALEMAALGVSSSSTVTKLASSSSSSGGTSSGSKSGHALTEAVILEEAQRLKQVHGIKDEELVLSVGWLARFKHRNGIRLRKSSSSGKQMPTTTFLGTATTLTAPELLFDDSSSSSSRSALLSGSDASAFAVPPPQSLDVAPLLQHSASHALEPALKRAALSPPSSSINSDSGSTTTTSACEQLLLLPLASPLQRSSLCAFINRDASRSAALERAVSATPSAIRAFACACEAALPAAVHGLQVAVLGCCSVAEAFVLAALVGADGSVTCVDSDVASVRAAEPLIESHAAALGYPAPNIRVLHGLRATTGAGATTTAAGDSCSSGASLSAAEACSGIGAAEFDLVVLNCSLRAVAPSDATAQVLAVAHSALRDGGELRLSTCCSSRRLSPAFCSAYSAKLQSPAATHDSGDALQHRTGAPGSADTQSNAAAVVPPPPRAHIAVIECAVVVDELLRAVYAADFRRAAQRAGFVEPRRLPELALALVSDSGTRSTLSVESSARFAVVVWRLFKTTARADDCAEDYGQYAVYTGSDADDDDVYELDQDFRFARGAHVRVDGNTAQLLQRSWLRRFFTVVGDQSSHLGAFVPSGSGGASFV